jgi:hypothetical protein
MTWELIPSFRTTRRRSGFACSLSWTAFAPVASSHPRGGSWPVEPDRRRYRWGDTDPALPSALYLKGEKVAGARPCPGPAWPAAPSLRWQPQGDTETSPAMVTLEEADPLELRRTDVETQSLERAASPGASTVIPGVARIRLGPGRPCSDARRTRTPNK